MKKILLIFILFSSALAAKSQVIVLMNTVASTATGNYEREIGTGIKIGSIQIVTNGAFNGSTTTAALYASNDGTNWLPQFQDDNVTPCSFTLTAGANNYQWSIKATVCKFYRIVYTKGDATLGTVRAVMNVH